VRQFVGLRPGRKQGLLLTLWVAAALWLAASCAVAHPQTSFNVRVVHFEHRPDGMVAFVRLSFPLVVANGLGPRREDQTYEPAPFTYNRIESGRVFHYVDAQAVQRDIAGLAKLAAQGHRVSVGGTVIAPQVLSARVHSKGYVPPFDNLAQARAATHGAPYVADAPETDVGYALVDLAVFYPMRGGIRQFQVTSSLRPGLLGEPATNNLLIDHRDDSAVTYALAGLLEAPVTVNPPAITAIAQFLSAGLAHILDGADHILFVVCLVIGASRFGTLAWRITGFSVGHSITLAAGFCGLLPAGAWFVPVVEAAIALSILYAAVSAVSGRDSGRLTMLLTALMGMLHGFGFAIGLREMLTASSPHVGMSLLSFNLGVEVGQLAVALCAWSFLFLAGHLESRSNLRFMRLAWLRNGVAGGSAMIAVIWLAQRVPGALSVL
jgi:hypothetical protein